MTNLQTIVPQTAGANWLSSLLLLLILPFFSTGSVQAQTSTDYAETQNLHSSKKYILVAKHSGKALDVPASGAQQLLQWSRHNGLNQQFQIIKKGNGYYQLMGVKSGKLLEAKDGKVMATTSTSGDAVLWKLLDKGNGYCAIIAKTGGRNFDVPAQSKDNGAKIGLWGAHTGDHHQFKFIEAPVTAAELMYVDCVKNDKVVGSFVSTGVGEWAQYKVNTRGKSVATYKETSRGKFSVFLTDVSTGAKVVVNLHTKKVTSNDNPMYDIANPKGNAWVPYKPLLKSPAYNSASFYFQVVDTDGLSSFFNGKQQDKNYYYMIPEFGGSTKVVIKNAHAGTSMEWALEPTSAGYYRIERQGKYCTITNGDATNGWSIELQSQRNDKSQEFRLERNIQGYTRMISRLNSNYFLGRAPQAANNMSDIKLYVGERGTQTLFRSVLLQSGSGTAAPAGSTLKLYDEQYAAPVSQKPITPKEFGEINFIGFNGGALHKLEGQAEWVRYDNSGVIVDILLETKRGNGTISLKTYNQFIYNHTVAALTETPDNFADIQVNFSELNVYTLHVHSTRSHRIHNRSDKALSLSSLGVADDMDKLRVVTFNGLVTMAYMSKKLMGGSDGVCSAGADHHKTLFDSACKSHDMNYNAPWKEAGYGKGTAHRISDAIFLEDLKAIVDGSLNPIDYNAAGFFYRGVRGTQQGEDSSNAGYEGAHNYNKAIYVPDEKMRKAFTEVIDEEYSKDIVDHFFRAGEAVKDFFADDVADWFSDNF